MSPENRLYGRPRLKQQFGGTEAAISGAGWAIPDDVRRFTAGRPHRDGICMGYFGRAG